MQLGEMTLEDAAKESAGNWKHFECFSWHRRSEIPDAENWCIIYTQHRDSELLDQSNANAIDTALEPFTKGRNPDGVAEHHHHWACGWVDGYSIRIFRRGRITKAFKVYHGLAERLANYPVLDESDYSAREYEATLENFADAAWRLKREYDLPKNWQREVYNWFSDNEDSAIENSDDRGAYPSEEQLQAAFQALGYEQAAAV